MEETGDKGARCEFSRRQRNNSLLGSRNYPGHRE